MKKNIAIIILSLVLLASLFRVFGVHVLTITKTILQEKEDCSKESGSISLINYTDGTSYVQCYQPSKTIWNHKY